MSTASRSSTESCHNAIVVLFALGSFDGLLTMVSVGSGIAYESNPVMAALYVVHPLFFFCVKQAMMYACCMMLVKAVPTRPEAVLYITLSSCLLYTLIGA